MSVVVAASLVDDDSELSSFLEEGILPEKLVILVEVGWYGYIPVFFSRIR